MHYIHIEEPYSTQGFYLLIRQGSKEGSVQVLPNHVYIVNESHLSMLKEEGIPFDVLTKDQLPVQPSRVV